MEECELSTTKKRRMKKLFMLLGVCATMSAYGQSVSYSHDAAKMNQITVMEIGSGTLTPEYYY